MQFLSNYFEHTRFFTAATQALGATGEFKLGTLNATVRVGERQVDFLAQFLVRKPDGGMNYSMRLEESAEGFIGWLPYFNKRWVEAYDKLAFKQRCAALQLPVPAWSADSAAAVQGDFVVKSARGSSFGSGVRGPFAAKEAGAMVLQPGDYADQFVPGQVGKAWYWNDRVVALDLRRPVSVVGDGVASLAELVKRVRRSADVTSLTDFFRYRGLTWDVVPARGETVVIDYKYGSPFGYARRQSSNRVKELQDTPLMAQLNGWGPAFWGTVPEPVRQGTLYTVDFVLSDSAGIRLLEMNCNPMVPPELYEVIVPAAFGDAIAGMDSVRPMVQVNPSAATVAPPLPPLSSLPPPAPPVSMPDAPLPGMPWNPSAIGASGTTNI